MLLTAHVNYFVEDFRAQQMRLLASYHGIYYEGEFRRSWPSIYEWYEIVVLSIKKGRMALRDVGAVSLAAFDCSIAASLKNMATIFTDWVTVGQDGALIQTSQDKSLNMSSQVIRFVRDYRRRVPKGLFKENEVFLVLKTL